MNEIYALTKTNKDIADLEEVKILLRFLNEQANYDETNGQFKAKTNNCPHRSKCPLKEQKKNMLIKISKKSIMASLVREEVNDSHINRENTSKRAAIEGTNSAIKGCQGARRLRVRGKIKCALQIGFKVISHNFKQIFRALSNQIKKRKPKANGLLCPNPNY